MSGSPPSAPTGVPAPRPEDPAAAAAADKRVLVIAVVVMLLLVSVGVVSGALFNRSACATIDPDPVASGAVGGAGDVDQVLAAAFPDTEEDARNAMAGALDTLSERLGPVTGVAEVTGATGLGATDRGVAAVGSVTSLLDAPGSEVLARVDVGDGQVIGSGDTLYSVAAVNELTGQVDAVVPLDENLEAQTCVNTSLINSPLAFVLDAREGELLLLRIDEDGGEPELELRDPVEGRVWGPRLDIGIAQPGIQGERLTGRLGPELAVTGRRTVAGETEPVLTAVDRGSGEIVWTVDRDDLGDRLDAELPDAVEVWEVGVDTIVAGLSTDAEPDDDQQQRSAATVPPRLVAFRTADGAVLWEQTLAAGDEVRHVAIDPTDERRIWITIADDDGVRFTQREHHDGADDGEGELTTVTGTTGDDGSITVLDDGRAVAVTADSLSIVDVGTNDAFAGDLSARDAVAHHGGLTVLFEGPDAGALAVTYGG
jgi:outer membrane protein assembly factor BamB